MIKISIVIVNFNSGLFLKDCLISIQKSYLSPSDYEVIIVDNASQDKSLESISSIANFNFQIIQNKKNIGFAKANNVGIKKSRGKYILLLNPDTLLEKNTLKAMLQYMDKNPDVAVSTCKVDLPDGTLDDACHRGFPTPWNAFWYFSGVSNLFPYSPFFNGYHLGFSGMNRVHEIDSCVGAFMMIRKEIGEQLGWLSEDYFWYGEDLDFCYRVKEKGFKIMYNPTVKIIHYKGITSGLKSHSKHLSSATLDTKRLATQARFDVMSLFYRKHYLHKYPSIITNMVLLGIELKRKVSLLSLK